MALLVSDESASGRPPRWDGHRWWNGQPGGCKWAPVPLELRPGAVGEIGTLPVESAVILGDSMPARRYRSAIRLRFLWPRDTTLVIPAGSVDLGG